MAAGSVSLESALRTCKVDTAWASRIESDRFLNPNNMVCPVWNGMDSSGRHVCKDSYYTKRAGCNSASDRISVENDISRPQYMEYITLSANGIAGNIYGQTDQYQESVERRNELANLNNITGNFGSQYGSNIKSNCGFSKHDTHHNHRHHNNPPVGPAPGPPVGPGGHSGYPGSNIQHQRGVAYNAQNRRNNAGF